MLSSVLNCVLCKESYFYSRIFKSPVTCLAYFPQYVNLSLSSTGDQCVREGRCSCTNTFVFILLQNDLCSFAFLLPFHLVVMHVLDLGS